MSSKWTIAYLSTIITIIYCYAIAANLKREKCHRVDESCPTYYYYPRHLIGHLYLILRYSHER